MATALVVPMEPSGALKHNHAFSSADRTQSTTPLLVRACATLAMVLSTANAAFAPTTIISAKDTA